MQCDWLYSSRFVSAMPTRYSEYLKNPFGISMYSFRVYASSLVLENVSNMIDDLIPR
jgi:hypothetical protein